VLVGGDLKWKQESLNHRTQRRKLAERERGLNEEIDKAVEWGSPRGVARRLWIAIKQAIKDVYESLPLPPLKKG
jgi:hypothetical protein